ncbi:MAG TPA: hypothetical protein DCG75_19385 [Bacteroidales bacterium]|jgi:type IX secretion system PorP/SprF family membrane protein|nr:hypothetical protein [Bacteroidales bacterium]
MISKTIKLFILFFSISLIVKAQQDNLKYLDYNNLITSPDVFFDKKSFNPSYTGDTVKLKANLKKMTYWLGYEDSKDLTGISIETYMRKNNSGIGVLYLYDKDFFKSHVLKFDYNYRFTINDKIKVRTAISLGINHYTLIDEIITYEPDPLLANNNDWCDHPILSVGTLLNFKRHELGITYADIFNFDLTSTNWSDPKIFNNYFVINYNYKFQLTETIILTPEIINYWNPDYNIWIITSSASFKNRIYTGILLRSNNDFGFMFGGRPWKRLKMSYVYTYNDKNIDISGLNYGFQGINFSFIL